VQGRGENPSPRPALGGLGYGLGLELGQMSPGDVEESVTFGVRLRLTAHPLTNMPI
jgi:hypothetical protein